MLDANLKRSIFRVFVNVGMSENVEMRPAMHELQKSLANRPILSRYRVSLFNVGDPPAR